MTTLPTRLRTEADLCRNDGAEDIAALLDEAATALQEAQRDARRYRWLRSNRWHEAKQLGNPRYLMDAAIDAALSRAALDELHQMDQEIAK